jgi:hypothetical protein
MQCQAGPYVVSKSFKNSERENQSPDIKKSENGRKKGWN